VYRCMHDLSVLRHEGLDQGWFARKAFGTIVSYIFVGSLRSRRLAMQMLEMLLPVVGLEQSDAAIHDRSRALGLFKVSASPQTAFGGPSTTSPDPHFAWADASNAGAPPVSLFGILLRFASLQYC